MNIKVKILTIILFFGFLVGLPIITVITPKEYFSEQENKNLATFPTFDIEDVKNKEYMNDIDTFVSDHFAFRTDWISFKTDIDLTIGRQEISGVYFTEDMLLADFTDPDYETVDESINAINAFARNNEVPTYVMIVPTAIEIYREELDKNAPILSQKEFIDDFYSGLTNENVVKLDSFTPLLAARNEYIYYNTDHHWTSLGAYYAYAATIDEMGQTPLALSDFNIEHVSNDFYGTTYSKVLYDGVEPDTIDFYHNANGTKVTSLEVIGGQTPVVNDTIYFRDFLDEKDKYGAFTGSNSPLVTIKSSIEDGEKLLLIKDSYAHCYVQFLGEHYSQIDMLDLRYINTYADELMNIEDYDRVLILYNADTLATDNNIVKLTKEK